MVVAATMSASDSNFVAAKKNGFACSGCGDYDLPRPILIFVAAKKNGFACYAVATTRSVSDSNLRRRKEEWFRLQNDAATQGCIDS